MTHLKGGPQSRDGRASAGIRGCLGDTDEVEQRRDSDRRARGDLHGLGVAREVAVAARAGRQQRGVQLPAGGQRPTLRRLSCPLGDRLGAESPGGLLDAAQRGFCWYDVQRSSAEHDRRAVQGASNIADHDETGLSGQLGEGADRVKALCGPYRCQAPNALRRVKPQLPRDLRVVGVVVARDADGELKAAGPQRFDDALKRRVLLVGLPAGDG